MIPGVAISTDMISGFCAETEEEHQHTVDLMNVAEFDQVYIYIHEYMHTYMYINTPKEVRRGTSTL